MNEQNLTTNSKLNKDDISCFDIPAKETCWAAGYHKEGCAHICYADKNFYLMPVVKKAQYRRLANSKKDDFVLNMIIEIIESQKNYIRIHSSGDFYSREYQQKWFSICEALPHVTFYAYTKTIPLFINEKLPDNFTVIYSYGGKYDHMIDKNKHRHAIIYPKGGKCPKGYSDASKSDLVAIGKNKRIALEFH